MREEHYSWNLSLRIDRPLEVSDRAASPLPFVWRYYGFSSLLGGEQPALRRIIIFHFAFICQFLDEDVAAASFSGSPFAL